MEEVTAEEIKELAGLGCLATVRRWANQHRLIPKPTIRPPEGGRGRTAYWPGWVVDRCVQIKLLRKAGKSLSDIRAMLGDDWGEVEKRHREKSARSYRFADASRQLDKEQACRNLSESVADFISGWSQARRSSTNPKNGVFLIPPETVMAAVELLQDGYNPVLVMTHDSEFVTADFAVSLQLSRRGLVEEAFLVVPISRELRAYASSFVDLPKQAAVTAAPRVRVGAGPQAEECDACLVDTWGFEVAASKRSKKDRTKKKR